MRPIRVPDDFQPLAELVNQDSPEPTTAERELEWYHKFPEDGIRFRFMAEAETGHIQGYGNSSRVPWAKPGQFYVRALVDQGARGQGLGAALLAEAERFARENGGTNLLSFVRDNNPAALAFAQKHGYRIDRHLFESTLDLAAFDDTPWEGVVDSVKASGIRFFTLADEPGEANERKLYDEVYVRNCPDIPGYDLPEFEPYQQWRKWVLEGTNSRPDLIIIAADGDRFAGATVMQPQDTGALYTNHTSVAREYRGRKLALALKLLSVEAGRRYGAPYLRTNNDSENAPMLAVNRKLGYVPAPGIYDLIKEL